MLSWFLTDGLLIAAGVFLTVHLLTDARRMVQVLRYQRHATTTTASAHTLLCARCGMIKEGVKEAWWEIATLAALLGHFILSGELMQLLTWVVDI